jgi:hypothetical protein
MVWGAVGNDVADHIEIPSEVKPEFGKAYIFDGEKVRLSSKKAEAGFIGIATDTASLAANNDGDKGPKLPVAVAGFVPAFVDKDYAPGTALVVSAGGFLTKAGFFTKLFKPEAIVGTYYKKSRLEEWNGVKLDGRVLVKVV